MIFCMKRIFENIFLGFLLLIFLVSCASTKKRGDSSVAEIKARGTVLIGTTGDYRPLTYMEENGKYWGFGIEIAEKIAQHLGVKAEFVPTSWVTLSADTQATLKKFDFAIGGITITESRKETMLMSQGYLANGKTILCRAEDSERFQALSDIDKSDVRVMVNPGGLNEKFAHENLKNAKIIVFNQNELIPNEIAVGNADVMITEITEAPWYVKNDSRLDAPLLTAPFTHGQIGVLMQKGQEDLLALVNNILSQLEKDGTLSQLRQKYGLQ